MPSSADAPDRVSAVADRAARVVGRHQVGLVVLALAVGTGAGLGAVAFRYLIEGFTKVFSGHTDYSDAGRAAHHLVPALGPWFVLLAPVVAGLVYGPLVHRFAPEARGHGVPEVMFAVARNGGRIRPRVALVKSLASALCIGGGGSVGREGPIVQIGSALGSSIAQALRLDERHIRLLVACGAAGGIAATFNAPLAGVFFSMELILGVWAAESFGMVVLSSVTASVIARGILGDEPFLRLPAFHVDHLTQYPLFAVLGLLAGLLGVGFSRVLYAVEDVCDWAWRGPEWLRPAVGGLLLGVVLLVLPQMYGVGYPVLDKAVGGGYGIAFLCVLLVGKMLACSLTIGIGGSGGVFAPSLFVGAMLGAAFGAVVHAIDPSQAGSPGAYALVGMGALFAGAARAPITAVVILFELTGEYSIILPLMLAIVLATGVSHLVSHDTVYTRKLLRRGIDLDEPGDDRLRRTTVADVMTAPPSPMLETTTLHEAAARFAATAEPALPVVSDDGHLVGIIAAHELMDALASGTTVRIVELTGSSASVEADLPVGDALVMLEHGIEVLGVVADGVLIGWVGHREIIGVFA
ncbi:chloride channel protein [Aeromicrobium sp. A1-2]|uniref:chloride channel protein n=1 Tax=Aeromicrobium sp. A1-2 TaxID=2107713 RepID=UPI000E51C319|nr:chloride channel protein [Aeromicrobium sp. A1-2]AXT86345.1 chloride channel protein [Aeromicrobium sp. A1-2]